MLTRQQTLADLAARVRRAGFDYRDAQRKYDLYSHTLLPKARQLVKAREGAFRGGTASFLDLVDAQRVLLEFNLAVARARADRGKSLARIEALLGQSVTSSHVADQ
jgi:outer membrane protein TolC